MRIAVASNNGETVGQHFGRVRGFVVLTMEGEEIVDREERDNPKRRSSSDGEVHGHADCSEAAGAVPDCTVLIAGGMGMGAFERFRMAGIEPVLTDALSVDEAALRYARGDLPHLPDRVHTGGHHGNRG